MTNIFRKNAMLLNNFFLKIKYFRHTFVSSLYIFSLLIVGSLPIETALSPAQASRFAARRLRNMSECLWNFLVKINTHTFWHSHRPYEFCKPEILPTKNVSYPPYEACEFICTRRDHKFMARNILYTTGLIGDANATDISLSNASLNNDNDRIEYTCPSQR